MPILLLFWFPACRFTLSCSRKVRGSSEIPIPSWAKAAAPAALVLTSPYPGSSPAPPAAFISCYGSLPECESLSLWGYSLLIGPIFNLLNDFWTLASSGPTYISHERSPSGVERKETWHAAREFGTNGAEGINSSREKWKRRALGTTEPPFKTRLNEAILVVNSSLKRVSL